MTAEWYCGLHGTVLRAGDVCGECGPGDISVTVTNRPAQRAALAADIARANRLEYCEDLSAYVERSAHHREAARLAHETRRGARELLALANDVLLPHGSSDLDRWARMLGVLRIEPV